ncbi:hypothetical protein GH714_014485 [Hevea brasiliensis]|uniref:protein phosphatase methylesterase-1 n=1 Tax=Hevea brasiliensis TaxID=3981 RepID=A0A6A6LGN3_HEVBR|nr:hypothetical protein GH714_014485 [Hevea brasiliensis]
MESSKNLTSLPEEGQEDDNHEEQEGKDTRKPSVSAFASVPHRPPSAQSSLQKYSPLDWKEFFDREEDVCIPNSNDVFHVYMAGSEGPVVFCLHGGGYSGLSFALSASKIKEKARVVAIDLRGHGKTSTENDLDLSIETLSNDVLAILKEMYGDSPPAIVLVGHRLYSFCKLICIGLTMFPIFKHGGSVAVHVAAKKALCSLAGLVVVDVVEGTAMASLVHMQKILSNRMQHFSSIEKAVEWSVKGGSLRNIDSARISVPTTLKYDDSKKCYVYRARLEETEQYWRGWYEGLSEKFLSSPVPKLLLLAGTDRLDRALTIGQMQGKFQMVVVRHTGHAIQEDVPDEFATLIVNFISRNRIGPHGVESRAHYCFRFYSVSSIDASQCKKLHTDELRPIATPKQVFKIIGLLRSNEDDLESKLCKLKSKTIYYIGGSGSSSLSSKKRSALHFFQWIRHWQPELECNSDICSLIIDNCGRLGDYDAMQCLLNDFSLKSLSIDNKAFGFLPSTGTTETLLRKSTQRVIDILCEVGGTCYGTGVYSLIEMFSDLGSFDMAKFVIEKTERRLSFYNVLIKEMCRRCDFKGARDMMDEIREAGCNPSSQTYNYIISNLLKNGKNADAYELFQKMKESNCSPDALTLRYLYVTLVVEASWMLLLSF